MKKILSIILVLLLSLSLFSGCKSETPEVTTSATVTKEAVCPLPETLKINALEDCTVSVALAKDDISTDDNGKMVMNLKVYSYELYDMADIASLKENDVIVRQNEEIKVTELTKLESGLISINGGEENGGFDLISTDDTVYFEIGMNDAKAYYELGEVKIPVSENFEYTDESDLESEAKIYNQEDFLKDDSVIEYNFIPHNTTVVIENGVVTKMKKTYMP